MRFSLLFHPLLTLLLLTALAVPVLAQESLRMAFYDLETGELAYRGLRKIWSENGVVMEDTHYYDLDGTTVQTLEGQYDEQTLHLIRYSFEDLHSGRADSMVREGKEVVFRRRDSREQSWQVERVPWRNDMVFSFALMPLVHANWDTLAKGNAMTLDMLIAGRADTIGMHLERDGETACDTGRCAVFRMTASSWLIRPFLEPLVFYLERDGARRLVEFRGRSSFRDANGNVRYMRVRYWPAETELPAAQSASPSRAPAG